MNFKPWNRLKRGQKTFRIIFYILTASATVGYLLIGNWLLYALLTR